MDINKIVTIYTSYDVKVFDDVQWCRPTHDELGNELSAKEINFIIDKLLDEIPNMDLDFDAEEDGI